MDEEERLFCKVYAAIGGVFMFGVIVGFVIGFLV